MSMPTVLGPPAWKVVSAATVVYSFWRCTGMARSVVHPPSAPCRKSPHCTVWPRRSGWKGISFDTASAPVANRAGKQARREQLDEQLGVGDEVLALDLPEEVEDEAEETEEVDAAPRKKKRVDRGGDAVPIAGKTSRFQRPDPTAQDRLVSSDDDEDEAEEEEAPEKWNARAYHVSQNEDPEPESDDEEAVEMQLAEVRRIQQERRAKLRESDFAPFKQRDGLALPSVGGSKTIRIDAKRCVGWYDRCRRTQAARRQVRPVRAAELPVKSACDRAPSAKRARGTGTGR